MKSTAPAPPETLTANMAYSVVMTGNSTWAFTIQASTNVLGTMDSSFSANEGGGWFLVSSGHILQMQVNLQPASVPEPSTIVTAVLGIMICGTGELYRRHRSPLRVS